MRQELKKYSVCLIPIMDLQYRIVKISNQKFSTLRLRLLHILLVLETRL